MLFYDFTTFWVECIPLKTNDFVAYCNERKSAFVKTANLDAKKTCRVLIETLLLLFPVKRLHQLSLPTRP